MLRITTVFLIFSFVNSIYASDYLFIAETQIGDEFYINESSIRMNLDKKEIEVLTSYGRKSPFNSSWSSIQIIQFNCNGEFQSMSETSYSEKMARGNIIESLNWPMPVMKIPSGSTWAEVEKVVCN